MNNNKEVIRLVKILKEVVYSDPDMRKLLVNLREATYTADEIPMIQKVGSPKNKDGSPKNKDGSPKNSSEKEFFKKGPKGSRSKALSEVEALCKLADDYIKAEGKSNAYIRKFRLILQCAYYLNTFIKLNPTTGLPEDFIRSLQDGNIENQEKSILASDVKKNDRKRFLKKLDGFIGDEMISSWVRQKDKETQEVTTTTTPNPKYKSDFEVTEEDLVDFLNTCMGVKGGTKEHEYISAATKTTIVLGNANEFHNYLKREYPDESAAVSSDESAAVSSDEYKSTIKIEDLDTIKELGKSFDELIENPANNKRQIKDKLLSFSNKIKLFIGKNKSVAQYKKTKPVFVKDLSEILNKSAEIFKYLETGSEEVNISELLIKFNDELDDLFLKYRNDNEVVHVIDLLNIDSDNIEQLDKMYSDSSDSFETDQVNKALDRIDIREQLLGPADVIDRIEDRSKEINEIYEEAVPVYDLWCQFVLGKVDGEVVNIPGVEEGDSEQNETIKKLREEKYRQLVAVFRKGGLDYKRFSQLCLEIYNISRDGSNSTFTWFDIAMATGLDFSGTSGARQYFQQRFGKIMRFSQNPELLGEIAALALEKNIEFYEKLGLEKEFAASEIDQKTWDLIKSIKQEDLTDFYEMKDFEDTQFYRENRENLSNEELVNLAKSHEEIQKAISIMLTGESDQTQFKYFYTKIIDMYSREIYVKTENKLAPAIIEVVDNFFGNIGFGKSKTGKPVKKYGDVDRAYGKDFFKPIINIIMGQAGLKQSDTVSIESIKKIPKDIFADKVLNTVIKTLKFSGLNDDIRLAFESLIVKGKDEKGKEIDIISGRGQKLINALYDDYQDDLSSNVNNIGNLISIFKQGDAEDTSIIDDGEIDPGNFRMWFNKIKKNKFAEMFVMSLKEAEMDSELGTPSLLNPANIPDPDLQKEIQDLIKKLSK